MDEDLRGCLDNTKLNHQEATFKLVADFVRENGERKCCRCHCIKESQERVRVLPRQCSGRLTMISTGDFGEGMVGDFGDGAVRDIEDGMVQDDAVREDAIATGISSSVGDSGNVEQFGRKGMGFCRRQLKSKV